MAAPPLAADLIGAGLVLNFARSRRNRTRARRGQPQKPTVSRWSCRNKKAAVTIAAGFSLWWVTHWALYVIEQPDT